MNIINEISSYYSEVFRGHGIKESRSSGYVSFELSGILVTAALKYIMMEWLNMVAFYITGISFFWIGYIIYRYVSDKSLLKKWGFTMEGFRSTLVFLFPFILVCIIASLVYGSGRDDVNILNWRFIPVIFLYPLWGLFQQYIMLILIAGNLTELEKVNLSKTQVILITSLLFSAIHYPSFFLMIFTFIMEIIFLLAWFRWKNLLALGLVHGVVASFIIFYVLGRDLWLELFAWF